MPHSFSCKVYYEDTDLQGIVYYANYLRFIERARTEALAAYGIDQTDLIARDGLMFVVRRIEADYLQPARFGDTLDVETRVASVGAASLVMSQEVLRSGLALFRAKVSVAVISRNGRPSRMPGAMRQILRAKNQSSEHRTHSL
ncbi:MAG: tol-pal system-associated acyl-CoA thioesterase [Pseudomonadota bacterium]